MMQQLAMYKQQVATVVAEEWQEVDEIDEQSNRTGRRVAQATGRLRVVYYDASGERQVRMVKPTELTPFGFQGPSAPAPSAK